MSTMTEQATSGPSVAVKKVAVVGGGTMGNGIAQVFATNGFEVELIDARPEFVDRAIATITKNLDRVAKKQEWPADKAAGIVKRIHGGTSLDAAKDCQLVVEAVTESWELKKEIFTKLDAVCPPSTVLASNTSSISITEIAAITKRPGLVIGMHFMNPVPVMKLVEVIRGYNTTDAVTKAVMDLGRAIGKVPVEVHDYAGFVANRILMPMINEAIETLFQGVGGVEEIDTVMKLGMAHPMGPLQLADFIGLDTCLAILRVLHDGFGQPKYAPCPLLVQMVTAGKLGVKSGEGFYSYTAGSKESKVAPAFAVAS